MVGVLLYSDPKDDGSDEKSTYPNGPWRPTTSIQTGNVRFSSMYAGDALTPGWASLKDSYQRPVEEVRSVPLSKSTFCRLASNIGLQFWFNQSLVWTHSHYCKF